MQINTQHYNRACSCGREHRIEVNEILIESGAGKKLEKELKNGYLSIYRHPMILCDENTRAAAKDCLGEAFSLCRSMVLSPAGLHADNHAVAIVREKMEPDTDLILAVGSGTIHDLSRYVAFERKIPFVSVPTAASVDGFVSTVAAMTWDGMKVTTPAAPPIAVYADPDIFAAAPLRLNASGVGDLMGQYVCLADWKIAHMLTGEYYCEEIAKMEEEALGTVEKCLDKIAAGDGPACESLMYALILSGLAMQMVGNSRPASGAEHHMSHFWEMEVVNDTLDALHGEKVAVGTVYMLEKYKSIARLIREGKCRPHAWDGTYEPAAAGVFGKKGLLEGVRKENDPEPLLDVDPDTLSRLLPRIAGILEDLPDPEKMEAMLAAAACPRKACDIGLDESLVGVSLALSPYVRRRLTFNRVSRLLT